MARVAHQRTSNPRNVRKSLKRPGNVAGYSDTKRVIFPAVEAAEIFEPLKFLAFTAPYDTLLTDAGSGVPTGTPT
jgi:hypothetical protein